MALALGFAVGWPALLGLPARTGASVVVALGGAGGVARGGLTRGEPVLRGLPVVVALAVLLAFVNELARTDGRPRLVESVAGSVSGVLVAVRGGRLGGRAEDARPASASWWSGRWRCSSARSSRPCRSAAGPRPRSRVRRGVSAGWAPASSMPSVDLVAGAVLGVSVGLLVAVLHVLFERVPALVRAIGGGRRGPAAGLGQRDPGVRRRPGAARLTALARRRTCPSDRAPRIGS